MGGWPVAPGPRLNNSSCVAYARVRSARGCARVCLFIGVHPALRAPRHHPHRLFPARLQRRRLPGARPADPARRSDRLPRGRAETPVLGAAERFPSALQMLFPVLGLSLSFSCLSD